MKELRESQGAIDAIKGQVAKERVAIFIDGENITRKCRINVKALRELLSGGREVTTAIWRDSYRDQADYRRKARFYQAVGYNFKVKPVPLKTIGNGSLKSRVDVYLVKDIFERLLEEEIGKQVRTDIWILASEDSDFQPILELLKSRGRKVEVASFDDPSPELQQVTDRLIDLTQHRDEIGMMPLNKAKESIPEPQAKQVPVQRLQTTALASSPLQPPVSIQIQIQLAPSHSGTQGH